MFIPSEDWFVKRKFCPFYSISAKVDVGFFFRRDLEENLMRIDESRLKVPWFVKGRGCGCGNR